MAVIYVSVPVLSALFLKTSSEGSDQHQGGQTAPTGTVPSVPPDPGQEDVSAKRRMEGFCDATVLNGDLKFL